MNNPTTKQIGEIIDIAYGAVEYDDGREMERAIKLTWKKAQDEILEKIYLVINREKIYFSKPEIELNKAMDYYLDILKSKIIEELRNRKDVKQ
jgi:hypothetical protein